MGKTVYTKLLDLSILDKYNFKELNDQWVFQDVKAQRPGIVVYKGTYKMVRLSESRVNNAIYKEMLANSVRVSIDKDEFYRLRSEASTELFKFILNEHFKEVLKAASEYGTKMVNRVMRENLGDNFWCRNEDLVDEDEFKSFKSKVEGDYKMGRLLGLC